jgi:hypothetical protein
MWRDFLTTPSYRLSALIWSSQRNHHHTDVSTHLQSFSCPMHSSTNTLFVHWYIIEDNDEQVMCWVIITIKGATTTEQVMLSWWSVPFVNWVMSSLLCASSRQSVCASSFSLLFVSDVYFSNDSTWRPYGVRVLLATRGHPKKTASHFDGKASTIIIKIKDSSYNSIVPSWRTKQQCNLPPFNGSWTWVARWTLPPADPSILFPYASSFQYMRHFVRQSAIAMF